MNIVWVSLSSFINNLFKSATMMIIRNMVVSFDLSSYYMKRAFHRVLVQG